MTVVLEMRDRIAAAAETELRTRGVAFSATIAFAIADRALEGTQFEALVNYTQAVEAGEDPTEYRLALLTDPLIEEFITP